MYVCLCCGVAVTGVIGTKRLRYDIWGGDVLTANSMEEHAGRGRILVSETAHALLSEGDSYDFIPHEAVSVKSVGAVRTYLLKEIGEEARSSQPQAGA